MAKPERTPEAIRAIALQTLEKLAIQTARAIGRIRRLPAGSTPNLFDVFVRATDTLHEMAYVNEEVDKAEKAAFGPQGVTLL